MDKKKAILMILGRLWMVFVSVQAFFIFLRIWSGALPQLGLISGLLIGIAAIFAGDIPGLYEEVQNHA